MTCRTVAIMQPTYLPWSGYFDLMDQCDLFVFLDTVQFDKRSWQQRNRVKTDRGELYLTVPVLSKGRFEQRIAEAEIDASRHFEDTHVRTVDMAYAKAPHATPYLSQWAAVMRAGHGRLADLNIALIEWLRDAAGIPTKTLRASTLDVSGKRVELLVEICKAVGADHYLSPAGARAYIEENDLFGVNGIELSYQAYSAPRYRQLHGEFIPSLYTLDLLLNEGDRSLSLIRSGRHGA